MQSCGGDENTVFFGRTEAKQLRRVTLKLITGVGDIRSLTVATP